MKRFFQIVVFFLIASGAAMAAETQTRLLLSASTARPGETVWAGIELKMPAGWHSYWRNAGDSGSPTKVEWILPDGVTAGELNWPVPEKLVSKEGDITLITYVYDDVVVLLSPLQLSSNLTSGNVELKARVSWQECKESCLQGHSELSAPLEIGTKNVASSDAGYLENWRAKVPRFDAAPRARIAWESDKITGDSRPFVIEWDPGNAEGAKADFYPYSNKECEVQNATEQTIDPKSGKVLLHKSMTSSSGRWPDTVRGVLVSKGKQTEAIEVELPFSQQKAAVPQVPAKSEGKAKASTDFLTLLQMTLFAILGGLILNIMPCVLPVISLKVLGFVSESGKEPRRLLKLGAIYGVGVLVSFVVLALISIAIQRAGGIADWGAAFRNPQFRVIVTVLITLVALNLFGLFEVTLGGKTMNAAGQLTSKTGYSGAFFNGILATLLATPCTAPFLSAAVLFAFTQPPLVTVWIFLAVGFGLALPFVLICWRPRLLSFLPKPGVWMEHFKVAMGFPMLVTAVWLFSITATRLGKDGVLWLGIFLVLVGFAAWLWGQFVQRKRSLAAVALVVLVLGFGYQYILEGKLDWRHYVPATQEQKVGWQPWSREAVEKARKEGHPVLVDFTADSCLNCKFNKLTSLDIPATQAKLKEIGAVAFVADYTDENRAISEELARFNRAGVPLVVVFPGSTNGDPIVLPPILTPSMVMQALENVSRK